ncbi:BTB/POZ domain-containing protein 9-like [Adelges cooleyi]|uniref:BTB/POZ domain-containing protein 9-like n=1 Tax=Adelges cooleyi TaxID=133065 RepID=UPI002180993F|nr:BTB/POZ domain-containing protein 9-like [Adelges cooleyi]
MAQPRSSKASSSKASDNEIDHTDLLISDIGNLYQSGRILFFGGGTETYDLYVHIKDVSINSFKIILEYIYTGRIHLSDFEDEEILKLHKLSDYFGISQLKLSLNEYFQRSINIDNVCTFLDLTRHYENKELEVELLKFIDDNAVEVLKSYEFMDLSSEVLQEILDRDSFYAHELDIFRAVCRWVNKNQNEVERDTNIKVLSAVRYPIMSAEEQSQARESQLTVSDSTESDELMSVLTSINEEEVFSFGDPRVLKS